MHKLAGTSALILAVVIQCFSGQRASCSDAQLASLLQRYCAHCHSGPDAKGELELDKLATVPADESLLDSLVRVLVQGEMPPAGEPQPDDDLRQEVILALESAQAELIRSNHVQRLTREEYTNTVNDLLGTDFDLTNYLPPDSADEGFLKAGATQLISPRQVEAYLKTARFVADRVILDERPSENVWSFGPANFYGSGRGDYRSEEAFVLSTNYPWRSNLHFSDSSDDYSLFAIPEYGRYRFRLDVSIVNSDQDQTIGVNLGDPRYPTNFKKMRRYLLPSDADSLEIELIFRKGDHVSFTFDSAPTWNVGQKPKEYKGPQLFFRAAEVRGPIYRRWPTLASERIFSDIDANPETLTDHMLRLLVRRPLTVEDRDALIRLAHDRHAQTGDLKATARTLLTAILSSPYFIFRPHVTLSNNPVELDQRSLAHRLSFFLWSSAPDSQLLELARNDQLASDESLARQVDRMLRDPKINRFCEDFTRQWLQTDRIDDVSPDERVYKGVTNLQIDALAREPLAFFKEVLDNDLSLECFIDSNFAMVNDLSASFYGYEGVRGREYQRYSLSEETERGGLVGQAGILKLTSTNLDTSPIRRGVWILRSIYGQQLDPPENLKFEEPDLRGAETVKEVMSRHQSVEGCNRCHARIDPMGLALEQYDPLGRKRATYVRTEILQNANGKENIQQSTLPIDSEARLPDGRVVNSMRALKQVMLEDKVVIVKAFIGRLIAYSTGRKPNADDELYIDEVYDKIERDDFSLRSAIVAIVTHDAFRLK